MRCANRGTGMTYRELTRKLRTLGCEFKRQSKGSHRNLDQSSQKPLRGWCRTIRVISPAGPSTRYLKTAMAWDRDEFDAA